MFVCPASCNTEYRREDHDNIIIFLENIISACFILPCLPMCLRLGRKYEHVDRILLLDNFKYTAFGLPMWHEFGFS